MRLLILVLAASALVAGCGGDDPEPATGPGLPSQSALRSYFEAITSGDADDAAKAASDVAAAGSPAAGYAAYIEESDRALATADGEPSQPVDVEEVDGGFKACIAQGQCVTWADLSGKGGRLVSFTVAGVPLEKSLVDLTAQAPIEAAGLYSVQPEWAYRLPSGVLNVIVSVTASDAPLSPEPGTYIAGKVVLDGAKDVYPATVDAGASSPVVLSFPDAEDAELDGQVTFDLGIEGAGTESIGFGLADPAPS